MIQPKNESSTKRIRKEKTVTITDDKWILRLYVAGQTPKALTAFGNLKKICEEQLKGKYSIEVIDLLINPIRQEHVLYLRDHRLFYEQVQVIFLLMLVRQESGPPCPTLDLLKDQLLQ